MGKHRHRVPAWKVRVRRRLDSPGNVRRRRARPAVRLRAALRAGALLALSGLGALLLGALLALLLP